MIELSFLYFFYFYFYRPSDGEYIEHHLEIGDLFLIASDGLFDNLYEDFIVQIINNHLVSYSFKSNLKKKKII